MKGILLIALGLASLAQCNLLSARISGATPDEVETRIENVINGLLPETALDNQYSPKVSLTNRMAYYHTPGMSIAVGCHQRLYPARSQPPYHAVNPLQTARLRCLGFRYRPFHCRRARARPAGQPARASIVENCARLQHQAGPAPA